MLSHGRKRQHNVILKSQHMVLRYQLPVECAESYPLRYLQHNEL